MATSYHVATFVRIKKEISKEGGTVVTHWNSNDLMKKMSLELYKCYKSKTFPFRIFGLHFMFLSPTESIELLRYHLLPSTLIFVYLICLSFFLKEFCARVLIQDLSRSCGIEV